MNEPRNEEENLDEFDKCTIENCTCGYRGGNEVCLHKERCAYQLSEKWLSIHDPNEKSTIETILAIEKKRGKSLSFQEILAITPTHEIDQEKHRYIIDSKGNIFDMKKHRIIRHNLKF